MRAVTWQGRRKVSVDTVPDPAIKEPTDAIIRVTSTNICGSDLHLYEVLGAFMSPGDILGHEAMGVVEEVGREVRRPDGRRPSRDPVQHLAAGTASCAATGCRASARPPRTAIRARAPRCSATRSSTARWPAGRPNICGFRRRSTPTSRCRTEGPDERYVYLSDVLPTAWQAVEYAEVPDGGTLRGARTRPDRIDGVPDRVAPQELPGDRRRPRRRAAEPRARRTAATSSICARTTLEDIVDGPHRRPRRRRGDRRRRNGGARIADRRGRADRDRIPAVAGGSRGDEARRRGSSGRAQHRRSHWCAAAAPSRCPASTAVPPTRST